MAPIRSRSSGLFSGLVLISVGILLLLHNYAGLDLTSFFTRWWPLLIIFWGVIKLYERTLGRRFGGSGGGITGGEVFLVLAMLALMGIVVAVDIGKQRFGGAFEDMRGDNYEFDVDVPPKTVPANATIVVSNIRGDISVRGSDQTEIHVSAKKNVRTWSESEADKIAQPVKVEISQNGDSYEVHPSGYDSADERVSVDLDVTVPQKSPITIRTEKGDVTVSDLLAAVGVTDQSGDVEVRGTKGEVSVDTRKGDVKVSDTNGDVKIGGKGGEIEVNNTSGSLTVEGDFYGPLRADGIAKGVRIVSPKTDLTVSALAGHVEAGSGNLDIIDAPGNIVLHTRDQEVNVENPGGKVLIDNRNAQTSVRFTSMPKDDVTITNSSAGISLTLPGSSTFEIQAECHDCDIDSEFPGLEAVKTPSGDSSITGKYGSGRGPKITLRTSYGNIELQRTSISPRPGPTPAPHALPGPPNAPAPPVPPATEE